jgi:hypothetical protein
MRKATEGYVLQEVDRHKVTYVDSIILQATKSPNKVCYFTSYINKELKVILRELERKCITKFGKEWEINFSHKYGYSLRLK